MAVPASSPASTAPTLLGLPSELLLHIFSFLPPLSLAAVAACSRLLHDLSLDDLLWTPHLLANLPGHTAASLPSISARSLYIQHHPFWFVPRGKLWFGNSNSNPYNGKLLVTRYSPSRNAIEAFALVAERGVQTFEHWEHDSNVLIFHFAPRVQLHLDQVILRLDANAAYVPPLDADNNPDFLPAAATTPTPDRPTLVLRRWQKEVNMPIHNNPPTSGTFSRFMFSRALPKPAADHSSTKVWPPRTIPARERVRAQSANHYRASGHKPQRLDEISQSTFRLRKWVEFASPRTHHLSLTRELPPSTHTPLPLPGWLPLGTSLPAGISANPAASVNANGNINVRVGEDVTTFATLDPELYTPTPKKPWRGIWVGDYSGHGCEFLVILQPDEPVELPPTASWVLDRLRIESQRQAAASAMGLDGTPTGAGSASEFAALQAQHHAADIFGSMLGPNLNLADEPLSLLEALASGNPPSQTPYPSGSHTPHADDEADGNEDDDDDPIHTGGVYAVKLTGDPNIPRGEYTFIAPDIGRKGLLRVAREDIFQGARVVRSVGHIASRGFREDTYTPSQLILISGNRLAQYWEMSQHISFYERVDVDQFTTCD